MRKNGTGIGREWPGSNLLFSFLGNLEHLFQHLHESCATLGIVGIPHFSQLLHDLSHGLKLLEWTSILEGRAVASESFNSLVGALTFTKHWALVNDILHRQGAWILKARMKLMESGHVG